MSLETLRRVLSLDWGSTIVRMVFGEVAADDVAVVRVSEYSFDFVAVGFGQREKIMRRRSVEVMFCSCTGVFCLMFVDVFEVSEQMAIDLK